MLKAEARQKRIRERATWQPPLIVISVREAGRKVAQTVRESDAW